MNRNCTSSAAVPPKLYQFISIQAVAPERCQLSVLTVINV